MDEEVFHQYVTEAIESLPAWVRIKMQNLVFFVREDISRRQRRENRLEVGETLFGLYEGVPLSERGVETISMPDTITIFKRPILEAYTDENDVRTCIKNTIWHEVAHYLGHDEEWVRNEEKRRGMTY